jgi:hypothetical protein
MTAIMAVGCVRATTVDSRTQDPPGASTAPTASPAPTPVPTRAPTDPPVVEVPSSIDSSGETNISQELQRFVDDVPDGSTIAFEPGGIYRLIRGISLSDRRNLVFDGNGATFRMTGSGDRPEVSAFFLLAGNQDITIREFTLIGNNEDAGTSGAFDAGAEHQMGVLVRGGTDVTIHDMTMQRFYGDCVYVGTDSEGAWSDGVDVRDSTCTLTGRHGVTIIGGRDVTVERVNFDEIGMFVVDIEPNFATDGAAGVMIRDNTIGSYGLNDQFTSWVLAAVGAEGSVVEDVSFVGNIISGVERSGVAGDPRGLHVRVEARGPRRNFVVRDNVSSQTVAGPAIRFTGVEGVSVTGNTQPLSSGDLARFTDSTDVTYADNCDEESCL